MRIFLLLVFLKINRNHTDCDLLEQLFFHIITVFEDILVAR